MSYKDPEYHRQKSQEHYQKYKQQYNARNQAQKERTARLINEAKSCGCLVCGELEMVCLDFHHTNQAEKDVEVSRMWGMNDDRVRAEIAKCVVLCSNCHRKVHAGLITI